MRQLILSHRLTLMISEEELKLINDWQFEHRIKSTGEAVRQLIAIGLNRTALAEYEKEPD